MDAIADRPGQEGVSPPTLRAKARKPAVEHGIPRRLAPALTAAGGLLVALGALGTWIRVTSLPTGSTIPEQIAVGRGGSGSGGWILLGIGVVTVAASFAWPAREARLRVAAAGASVVAVAFVSVRLALIDGRAAEMAEEATGRTGIDAFHAGYGWGAWLMLVGAVLLTLALLSGGLREIDIRRRG